MASPGPIFKKSDDSHSCAAYPLCSILKSAMGANTLLSPGGLHSRGRRFSSLSLRGGESQQATEYDSIKAKIKARRGSSIACLSNGSSLTDNDPRNARCDNDFGVAHKYSSNEVTTAEAAANLRRKPSAARRYNRTSSGAMRNIQTSDGGSPNEIAFLSGASSENINIASLRCSSRSDSCPSLTRLPPVKTTTGVAVSSLDESSMSSLMPSAAGASFSPPAAMLAESPKSSVSYRRLTRNSAEFLEPLDGDRLKGTPITPRKASHVSASGIIDSPSGRSTQAARLSSSPSPFDHYEIDASADYDEDNSQSPSNSVADGRMPTFIGIVNSRRRLQPLTDDDNTLQNLSDQVSSHKPRIIQRSESSVTTGDAFGRSASSFFAGETSSSPQKHSILAPRRSVTFTKAPDASSGIATSPVSLREDNHSVSPSPSSGGSFTLLEQRIRWINYNGDDGGAGDREVGVEDPRKVRIRAAVNHCRCAANHCRRRIYDVLRICALQLIMYAVTVY